MLTVFVVLTAVGFLCLLIGFLFDKEGWSATGTIGLVAIGLICWGLLACTVPNRTVEFKVAKKDFDVVYCKTKVFVTQIKTDDTYTFNDAKTYNLVSQKKDSVFIFKVKYNLYNFEIERTLRLQ